MKFSPSLARMPILALVIVSRLTCAHAAGATAGVTATVKLGNSSYTDLVLADNAKEDIVNYLRQYIDSNIQLASTNMNGLYRGAQDDVVIANASISIAGTKTGEEAKFAVLRYLDSTDVDADIVNAQLNRTLGVPGGPLYVESIDFNVTAEADVTPGALATIFAAIRLGSRDYKDQLFGSMMTKRAAELGLTNFIADIPGARVEAGDLSQGYEPDMVLALADVKVENTKDSTEAKDALEAYREDPGFSIEAMNAELVKSLGNPPNNGVDYVTKFEEIRISLLQQQDQDSSPGRIMVYFVLTMGSRENRDLLLSEIEKAGASGPLSSILSFLREASNVELVSVGEGSGDFNVKAVFDVAVQGTETNAEARDFLQSLPLDEYSEQATTAIRTALSQTGLADDFVTKVVISGASAKRSNIEPEEGKSVSISTTANVQFNKADWEDKTRAYLNFEQQYLSDIEGLVKRKCGCEAAAEIASVTFASSGKRKLMAESATIVTNVYNANNADAESALMDTCSNGCTLGDSTISADSVSVGALEDSAGAGGGAGAARVYGLALFVALLMGALVA